MSTTPVTIDPSTFTPFPGPTPNREASSLQGAVSYGVQQDPVKYAKLLRLQGQLGVPPAVSHGNEQEVGQQADLNRLDPHALATMAPRTTSWATNPDNAAVAGVDEIHRVAGFEQKAAVMRAYSPTLWDRVTTGLRQAVKSATGKTTDELQQGLYEFPLTRGAIDVGGGVSGMTGNIGSFFGWHGDGLDKLNLLQRVETHLAPENNTDPAAVFHKSNEFDWLMKNVAPMVPAVLASGGVSTLARTLKLSDTASKVLAGLTVGALFDVDQAGKTYTGVAGAGGNDDDARLAANKVALINAPANALFGATDVVPLLRDNPLLTSLGLGGATGATGQVGQNVVTGQPWAKGVTSAMVQGAAMQGGMHVGLGAFAGHLADAVDSAEQSPLRERSPEKFDEAMQTVFAGDASLKIPAEAFQAHFTGAGMDPAEVAKGLGSTNYAEAVLSGGDVEVPPASYLSKLDPEHQKALLPHVVDPETGLTATQHAEGLEELKQWAAGDGPEQLQAEAAAADAETAATPEWQAVKEDLRQRYVDAGETPEVADSLATNHANVVANLARESGRTPAELMAMYAPKVTTGEAPGQPLYQEAIGKIRDVVDAANQPGDEKKWAVYAPASEWLQGAAKEAGLDLDGFSHGIDADAIRHAKNKHGDGESEAQRGQLAVTDEDFAKLPQVVNEPDRVVFGGKARSNNLDAIGYVKRLEDGTIVHVEEVRTGKNRLAAVTMRKHPAEMDVDEIAANLHRNVRDDGGRAETIVVKGPGADKNEVDPEILHQEPIDLAGRQYDSPEMADARSKAAAAEAAGDAEGAAQATERFHELRDADPRFQKVLAAREAYLQAKAAAAAAKPGDPELARAVNEAFTRWKDEAAKMQRPGTAEGAGGPRGWFRALPDGSFEIGKTKVGDLSTFVHEPAHAYLHMLRDLATREGASEALKDDFAKIQEFLGVDKEKAAAGDVELTREQQETWARANEQYLREGKAPSEGLKGVFQRFAVWLGSIYKKATDLGVELTPEIRAVFDRLYASEEGVNRAAQEAGPHLFTSAEEAGWTAEEFKRYAEQNGVSVSEAKAHILRMLNEAAARERTEAWRQEEASVRQAMAEMIDATPVYRAIRGLRRGELADGTPLKLDKASLIEQFGEDRVRKLQEQHPGLYRANGGADAEVAAEMHGFGSAAEMMRALEAAPRRNAAIDQATRAHMTAEYGDIRYDGTLDDQARLAIESDTRAKGLYRELKALKAKLAKVDAQRQAMRDITIAPLDAYREAAHQMVEKKAVANLQPMRYLDASRKYSREAFDALRSGKADAAATAKHKELMNHFLFREATAAKEYVGKFESYAKRAQGRTVQGNLGLAGSDYRAQFNKLMFRYGLSRPPAEMPERPLSAWADDLYEQGKEPAIDPALLDESRGVNYRQASVAEVRMLHDALKNIKALAYQEMHAVVNGRKIVFVEAKTAMMERARQSLEVHPEAIFPENRTSTDKARDYVNRKAAEWIRTEFMMKRLDGGLEGPWHDNLWNLAADSQGVERELQEGVTKVIGDALQNITDKQRLRLLDKVSIPGWGEETRSRLISMALNLGNDGNLDRLKKTFVFHGKDVAGIAKIPQMLSREDWQLVQGLWDSLKPMGQRMNDLERRLTGLPPVMVTPTPLHVDLADGSVIDLEGGYYPIVMDPRYSERAQQQDVTVSARNLMETGYGRAATSRGYTKERTGFAGPLLLDHEQVLTQHIAKASKDISHREFILAANRLLGDPAIQQTLRETVGPAYESQMMPWLRTIVNDRNGSAVQGLGDSSQWMGKLRTNVVQASLGFKLSTILLQVTHASSVFLHTTPAAYGQALVDFLAHPSEMTEQIQQLSPNEMKHRGENIDRDMRTVLQDGIQGQSIGKVVARAATFPLRLMDHLLSFPLWLAVYRAAQAEHAELPESEAQRLAMHRADGAVRMALGANAPKDLPAIMRRNDFWKMVTTLGGFENLKLNQIADAGYGVAADRRAGANVASTAGKFTYRMLMAAMVPAVLGAYVTGNRPKDDENPAEWAAKRALLFAPETIPLWGNIARAIDEGGDAKFTPIVSVVDKAVRAGSQAGSDKEDKDWTGIGLNAGEAAGLATGVPGTTQAARTLRYAHRAQMGEIQNPNAWDAVVGAPRK